MTNWNDASDSPDSTLYWADDQNSTDTGLFGGIIIKKESGVTSPKLDDFYMGFSAETLMEVADLFGVSDYLYRNKSPLSVGDSAGIH